MRNQKPVLVVDDDHVDVIMIERAFKKLNISNPLVNSSNGKEALDYLRNNGNEKPDIILLDLNMPKMNGKEFLKVVKTDDQLKIIPIIVLTTSDDPQDIEECFRLGVAGYMTKPADNKAFIEKIEKINYYWTLSELPDGN